VIVRDGRDVSGASTPGWDLFRVVIRVVSTDARNAFKRRRCRRPAAGASSEWRSSIFVVVDVDVDVVVGKIG
jgi:hypothetical protein